MKSTSFLAIIQNDRDFLRKYIGLLLGLAGFVLIIGLFGWFGYTIASENRRDAQLLNSVGLQKTLSQQIAKEILAVQKDAQNQKFNAKSFAALLAAQAAFDDVSRGFARGPVEFTYGGRSYTAPRLDEAFAETNQKIAAAWAPLNAQIQALGRAYAQTEAANKNMSARDKFIASRKTFTTEINEENKAFAFPNDEANQGKRFVPTLKMTTANDLLASEVTRTSNTFNSYSDELFGKVDALNTALNAQIERKGQANERWQLGMVTAAVVVFILLLAYFVRRSVVADYLAYQGAREKQAVFAAISDGTVLMDPVWRVTGECSASAHRLFGQRLEVGSSFSSLLATCVDSETMTKAMRFVQMIGAGKVKSEAVDTLNPLKQVALNLPGPTTGARVTRHVSFNFQRLTDARKRTIGILVSIQDSTERQKLAADLQAEVQKNRDFLQTLVSLRRSPKAPGVRRLMQKIRVLLASRSEQLKSAGSSGRMAKDVVRDLRNEIHGHKSEAGVLGVSLVQRALHDFEGRLAQLSAMERLTAQDVLGSDGVLGSEVLDVIGVVDAIATVTAAPAAPGSAPNAELGAALAEVVRQAAAEAGKKVQLNYDESSFANHPAFLRRQDQFRTILMHLCSNAVIHGIEPPRERATRGKPDAGTITVTGAQLQGSGRLAIRVRDDGAGFDVEGIKRRAREIGLARAAGSDLSDSDALGLLFEQGLSTATEPALGAGRGLGLSYVKEQVARMGGDIRMDHKKGQSAEFVIVLPHA